MYLEELLKCAYIKTDAPTEEEITLLLQGCLPQIDHHLVVRKPDFEEILMRNRATDPTSEAIMIAIGKAKPVPGDPIWGVMLQQESVVSRFTALCNAETESTLGFADEDTGPSSMGPEERVPDFDIPINPAGAVDTESGMEAPSESGLDFFGGGTVPGPENEPVTVEPEGSPLLGGDFPSTTQSGMEGPGEDFREPIAPQSSGEESISPAFHSFGNDDFAPPVSDSSVSEGTSVDTMPTFEDFDTEPDDIIDPTPMHQSELTKAAPMQEVPSNRFNIPDSGDGMSLYQDNPASHMRYTATPDESEAVDAPRPDEVTMEDTRGVTEKKAPQTITMGDIGEPGAFDAPDYPGAIDHILGNDEVKGQQVAPEEQAPVSDFASFDEMGTEGGVEEQSGDIDNPFAFDVRTPVDVMPEESESVADVDPFGRPMGVPSEVVPSAFESATSPDFSGLVEEQVDTSEGVSGAQLGHDPLLSPSDINTILSGTGGMPDPASMGFAPPEDTVPEGFTPPEDIVPEGFSPPGDTVPGGFEPPEDVPTPEEVVDEEAPAHVLEEPGVQDEATAEVGTASDPSEDTDSDEHPEPDRPLESNNNETVQFIRKSFTLFYTLAKQYGLETILKSEGLDAAAFCASVLQEFPMYNHQYTTSSAQPGATESKCAMDLIQALQLEAEEAALSGDTDRAELCVTPVFKLIYKE